MAKYRQGSRLPSTQAGAEGKARLKYSIFCPRPGSAGPVLNHAGREVRLDCVRARVGRHAEVCKLPLALPVSKQGLAALPAYCVVWSRQSVLHQQTLGYMCCMYMYSYIYLHVHAHAYTCPYAYAGVVAHVFQSGGFIPWTAAGRSAGGEMLPAQPVFSVFFLPCTSACEGMKRGMSSPSSTAFCASAPRGRLSPGRGMVPRGFQHPGPWHGANSTPKCTRWEDAIPGTGSGARRGRHYSCLCVSRREVCEWDKFSSQNTGPAQSVINCQPISSSCNHKELFWGRRPSRGQRKRGRPVPGDTSAYGSAARRCHWLPPARGRHRPAVKCPCGQHQGTQPRASQRRQPSRLIPSTRGDTGLHYTSR